MHRTEKPRRADALRNRERLLAAALAVFTERGTDVSLETVAREAGVGVGTLYRHFPTPDTLVEAAYLSELDRLHEGAAELLAEHPPRRRWPGGWTCSWSTPPRSAGCRERSSRSSPPAATPT